MWELYLPPAQRRDTTTRKGKTHREMRQRWDTEKKRRETTERDRGERQKREVHTLWVRTIAIAHLSKTDVNIPI